MQQVKDSPDIDTEEPVSRQLETNIYDYYGWQPYWGTGLFMGGYDFGNGARSVSPVPESRLRLRISPPRSEVTTIRICGVSRPSLGTIFMPTMAKSVTSRISSSRMPIGASNTSSLIRGIGGPAIRS